MKPQQRLNTLQFICYMVMVDCEVITCTHMLLLLNAITRDHLDF